LGIKKIMSQQQLMMQQKQQQNTEIVTKIYPDSKRLYFLLNRQEYEHMQNTIMCELFNVLSSIPTVVSPVIFSDDGFMQCQRKSTFSLETTKGSFWFELKPALLPTANSHKTITLMTGNRDDCLSNLGKLIDLIGQGINNGDSTN
jgi:hypothetical protein